MRLRKKRQTNYNLRKVDVYNWIEKHKMINKDYSGETPKCLFFIKVSGNGICEMFLKMDESYGRCCFCLTNFCSDTWRIFIALEIRKMRNRIRHERKKNGNKK